MKATFTLVLIMSVFVGLVNGQEKKTKAKRPGLWKDSVHAYQIIPYSGNPLVSTMPTDTGINGNVKMPNSYRKGGIEPIPMPTHRLSLRMLKRKLDSSANNSIKPVPMPNRKSYPVKPKE
jgi:hypothetical protein